MRFPALVVSPLLLLLPCLKDPPRVRISDNRRPAGALRNGVLTIHLDTRLGMWYPDGDSSAGALVPAFAEAGREPQIPGPLIRVPAGTERGERGRRSPTR